MLKHRVLTSLVLIPLMLLALFYLPPILFLVFTALITLLGAFEWAGLIGIKRPFFKIFYLIVVALSLFLALFVHVQWLFVGAVVFWLFAAMLIMLYPRGHAFWGKRIMPGSIMGIFVLTPCWGAVNYLHNQEGGLYVLLFLFVLIWGADTVAYFIGKRFGHTKLASIVSPGKSVEGAVAAILFGMLWSVLVLWENHIPLYLWPWVVLLSSLTVLFSIEGDLFESMIKREAHVKDSGRLLPGHGGVLDRIDSLTASAPVFALGGFLMGIYFGK